MAASQRDVDYIEGRLLDPAGSALEAIERLQRIGQFVLADRLMAAVKAFKDECRDVRREFVDTQQEGRRAR